MQNNKLFELITDELNLSEYEKSSLRKHLDQSADEMEELFARNIYNHLEENMHPLLNENYREAHEFRNRLFETWRLPLERLDALLHIGTEIVADIRVKYADSNLRNNKLNIATRLHARTVQVSQEISHLLHGGFADGAFARWRTLHETSVILKFICEGDEDLSTRFMDFQDITRITSATRYNKNNELGFEPFTDEQLIKFKEQQNAILNKYEPSFQNKFGWALKALNKESNPKSQANYIDIEQFVGMSFLRNHYSFANQYVHAGIDCIGYKLGTSLSEEDLLLTGPSNEGLLEPIQCTSLSLIHSTVALISAFPDTEDFLKIPVLWLWHEALKNEVSDASDALQKKATSEGL